MQTATRHKRWFTIACLVPLLAGCQAQWVSPYSAELQKKATDMIADVSTWEGQMRAAAGTAAADPRHPDVQARLNTWHGNVEAMADIERAIDPGSATCDAAIGKFTGAITDALIKHLPAAVAVGGSGLAPITHCETLPGIFTRIDQQVSGTTADAPGIPFVLAQQCELPWLSDAYFAALKQARATAGAPASATPVPAEARPGTPTKAQQDLAVARCRSLFVPEQGHGHGDAVSSLISQLGDIVYREGREAPTASH
jgi:hypothetical protein